MPALQKKHKKSSVHNIKSVMNTRYGAGDRTRTGTLSPAADFEWLYRFCFPQQSALHRSQKALILLAFLTFSCFY